MDRQVFREQLHKSLREILLEIIQQYFDQRFEAHQQVVRYISALDRKYDDAGVLKDGLPGIFGAIRDTLNADPHYGLSDIYFSAVERLVETFPEETIWQQDEKRFSAQGDDSVLISVGKSGKRSIRSLSRNWHKTAQKVVPIFNGSVQDWEPWKQNVPLRRLLNYYLLDPSVCIEWVHKLERVQLKIITDIEDQLISFSKSEQNIGLNDFAARMKAMIDTQKSDLKKMLQESIIEIESEIDWEVDKVGTIERSENFYSEQRLQSRKQKFEQFLQNNRNEWLDVQESLLNRTKSVAQFLSLRSEIQQESKQFLEDFSALFENNLDQPLRELETILEHAIQQVGKEQSVNRLVELKNRLASFTSEQLTAPIQKLLENQVCSRKVDHFFEELHLHASQTSKESYLIFDAKLDKNPPIVEKKEMEWQLLVIRSLREQIMNALSPTHQKYEDFLADMLNEIREIEKTIEINLESAVAAQTELSGETEDPVEIARNALQRISGKVEDLKERSDEKKNSIEKTVEEGVEKFKTSLLNLIHDGDAKELQLLNAKYKVKETTKDWRTLMDSRLAQVQDRLLLWWRYGWKKSKDYFSKIKAFAGFETPDVIEAKRVDIASYLSETDQKIKELPYIYRRLFDFQGAADERFYVPILESSNTFKKAFEQWQDSFPTTFAIVGEKGSGKSTFLDLKAQALGPIDAMRITLKDTIQTEHGLVSQLAEGLQLSGVESVPEIIEAIQKKGQPRMVVLENVQNSFVRNINGYEAIEKLCYLISETREQVFWAVSCSRYAWRFLDKVVQISEYFSHIGMSDVLNAEQIRNVILNRHRSSGYTLQFEPGDEMLKSRSYRKLKNQEEEAQAFLQKNYFEKLTEVAEGNASVAMIFWIRSIREYDDTYFYIQPLEVTTVEVIEDLSPQVLFALAAFVLHDVLSDEDLAKVLNLKIEESRLILNRLSSRGLLAEKGDKFVINHLMYRQIVRVLKERNIIHLV